MTPREIYELAQPVVDELCRQLGFDAVVLRPTDPLFLGFYKEGCVAFLPDLKAPWWYPALLAMIARPTAEIPTYRDEPVVWARPGLPLDPVPNRQLVEMAVTRAVAAWSGHTAAASAWGEVLRDAPSAISAGLQSQLELRLTGWRPIGGRLIDFEEVERAADRWRPTVPETPPIEIFVPAETITI